MGLVQRVKSIFKEDNRDFPPGFHEAMQDKPPVDWPEHPSTPEELDLAKENAKLYPAREALIPFAELSGELRGPDSRTLLITNGKSVTIGDLRRAAKAYHGTSSSPS